MSISEQEQQTLDSIGDGLAGSAPKLASMLAMFSRLAADEEMPAREPIRRAARGPRTSASIAVAHVDQARARRRYAGPATWRLLWLLAAVALLIVMLTLTPGTGKGGCVVSRTTSCGQAPALTQPGAARG